MRTQALALAQKGAFTLAELHAEAGRTRQACYLAAKGLVKEGLLRHVPGKTATAAAQYALTAPATVRGMAVVNSGHARVQLGVQRAAAEQLSAAEAFLASKEPLPPARPPVFHERGARHG
ncbi:MAG TPA: hypothetical protein VED01_03380 [Burkholderiales bacterium]|nr:hypothetical protein [Burkholderiales bacterium]